MWSVERPAHDVEAVFATCISRSEEPAHSRLLEAIPEVVKAAKEYEAAVSAGSTHLLKPADFRSAVAETNAELRTTYSSRMVRSKSPGRFIYNELKDAVEHDRCPMCGHRQVETLDHALPKKHFPLLSVTPINLVPCCSDCNHDKSEAVSQTAEEVFLHPYFDQVDKDSWLAVQILEGHPTGAIFYVDAPVSWSSVLAARVRNHFTSLGLADLYTAQAGGEISALEVLMESAHRRNGAEGVRETLSDLRDGRRLMYNNTWQGALFDALAASDWYCNGGFRA